MPVLLLLAVHADMRSLRASRHFAAVNDQLRAGAGQLRPPLLPPPQVETQTLVEPLSDEDIARMVARRKALLGPAIGLRRDVVADNLPQLDSAFEVTQDMKDHFGPPPSRHASLR